MIRNLLVALLALAVFLADDGGGVLLWPALLGVCCCGDVFYGDCGGQAGCTAVPLNWVLTVAGVTDGTCSDCNENVNGTFTLGPVGGPSCIWGGPNFNLCGEGSHHWRLDITNPAEEELTLVKNSNSAVRATYRHAAVGGWQCLGSNTLDYVSNDGACATFPATLTIVPA